MKFTQILGIKFFDDSLEKLINSKHAGLIVAPSAPVLAGMIKDKATYDALLNADIAIADSGLMVIVWFLRTGRWIKRISGLTYLKTLIQSEEFCKKDTTYWIMPNAEDDVKNRKWLKNNNKILLDDEFVYIAPIYPLGSLHDLELLKNIENKKPKFVIINIGGGVQERLGYYLKNNLSYKPTILCLGAAIAFISGQQVYIPKWVDSLYLGWLARTISSPKKYFSRYLVSLKIIPSIFKYKAMPIFVKL